MITALGKRRPKQQNPFAAASARNQLTEFKPTKKTIKKAKRKLIEFIIITFKVDSYVSFVFLGEIAAAKRPATHFSIQQAHDEICNSNNRADENIKKLLMFSSIKMDDSVTKKVNHLFRPLSHTSKIHFVLQLIQRAQNRKYVIEEKKPDAAEEEASVFTEEDFAKFEREYFVG